LGELSEGWLIVKRVGRADDPTSDSTWFFDEAIIA